MENRIGLMFPVILVMTYLVMGAKVQAQIPGGPDLQGIPPQIAELIPPIPQQGQQGATGEQLDQWQQRRVGPRGGSRGEKEGDLVWGKGTWGTWEQGSYGKGGFGTWEGLKVGSDSGEEGQRQGGPGPEGS
ncbi:hypothetical protein UPYG_G00095130, partial [Umbra pygmaea]